MGWPVLYWVKTGPAHNPKLDESVLMILILELLQLLVFVNLDIWQHDRHDDTSMMQVVYFVNSGTEANELAMLMARLYSGNLGMIALRNAYHGGSAGTIGLTALNTWKYSIPQVCINHHSLRRFIFSSCILIPRLFKSM